MLVQWPCAVRPWALPGLVAVDRDPQWKQAQGRRPPTPAPLVRLLWARLLRWLPERPCLLVGDTGYGPSETARVCGKPHTHLTSVSTCSGDAA